MSMIIGAIGAFASIAGIFVTIAIAFYPEETKARIEKIIRKGGKD